MATHPFVTPAELEHEDFPWCHVEKMCTPEITGAKELILVRATFPPGEQHNFHRHPHREEIIYILSGEAEQYVGGEKKRLKAGEMALIPANVAHMTRNPGPEPLLFLAILSPSDAPGEFTVNCFNEEPWKSICPPIDYGQ